MTVRDLDPDILEKSILVVAHPDDEILWLSSVVARVNKIIFCFTDYPAEPSLGAGRRKALVEYPLANVTSLDVEEAMSFNCADWEEPVESPYGLTITSRNKAAAAYRDNYHILHEKLSHMLAGAGNVITHNPWGEYGHEDHVQVFRVVESLRSELGFNMWYSNYCGNQSLRLMLKYISGFSSDYITLPTDIDLIHTVSNLYKKYRCWTWYKDYVWFREECLIMHRTDCQKDQPYGHFFPLNMIKTDFTGNNTVRRKGLKRRLRELISK
jgi:LmbE family N-acetylglucosaminyl deacetylase